MSIGIGLYSISMELLIICEKCNQTKSKNCCRNYYVKQYRDKNRLKIRQQNTIQARQRRATGEGRYVMLKAHSKERGITVTISKDNFAKWFDFQLKKCYYCGISEEDAANCF